MRTVTVTPKNIESRWYVVDASGKTLGRFVSEVARRLRGKHKPEYTPNMDLGDYIIVINAEKIRVTGKKFKDKIYWHHSGYIGGMKEIPFDKMLDKKPTFIIEKAVKGMLPKGPLGRQIFKKLKVYAGSNHPHGAQDPELIEI